MKATLGELLQRIPGPVTAKWPQGEPFAVAMRHGSMTVELFAPVEADTPGFAAWVVFWGPQGGEGGA